MGVSGLPKKKVAKKFDKKVQPFESAVRLRSTHLTMGTLSILTFFRHQFFNFFFENNFTRGVVKFNFTRGVVKSNFTRGVVKSKIDFFSIFQNWSKCQNLGAWCVDSTEKCVFSALGGGLAWNWGHQYDLGIFEAGDPRTGVPVSDKCKLNVEGVQIHNRAMRPHDLVVCKKVTGKMQECEMATGVIRRDGEQSK